MVKSAGAFLRFEAGGQIELLVVKLTPPPLPSAVLELLDS